MPAGLKADTIAAFLPQIFGRLNQYAKEFELGAVKSVALTLENGPLQIYNSGVIYLAVLVAAGAVLPVEKLNFIAAELAKHTK